MDSFSESCLEKTKARGIELQGKPFPQASSGGLLKENAHFSHIHAFFLMYQGRDVEAESIEELKLFLEIFKPPE